MPTAIPTTKPRLTARHLARLIWLRLQARYLLRRMERASPRVDRLGTERAGGRLLHFARRLLACHAEAAEILRCEEPPEVAQLRAIFERRPNS